MRLKDPGSLLLLAALWGGSFVLIRLAVSALGPILQVELRVGIAGLALALYAAARRALPVLRAGRWKYLVLGALNGTLPYTLIAAAEFHLTASLAVIPNAMVPLCTAVVGAIWLGDRLRGRQMAGIALGTTGVAILVGRSPLPLTPATALSIAAALGATVSYGVVDVFSKVAFAVHAPLTLAIGQQAGASVLLLPLALPDAAARLSTLRVIPGLALTVLALALLCTALAYLLFFHLLIHAGPMGSASVTSLTPVTGVAWGALLLREPVGAGAFAGGGLILLSVALVTGLGRRAMPNARANVPGGHTERA